MSIFCIIIGIAMLLGFTSAGYFGTQALINQDTIIELLRFAGMKSETLVSDITLAVTLVCFVIGLLFCLNWVILGVNCRNIKKLGRCRKGKAE